VGYQTIKAEEFETRRDLLQALEQAGISGAAAEAIAKETGRLRHHRRVAQAKEVAVTASKEMFGERVNRELAEGDPELFEASVELAHRALGALLCLLDKAGVGGTDGVAGHGTTRLACFSILGKGRKQATDGDAWSGAIREAAHVLCPGAEICATNGQVGLGVMSKECSEALTVPEIVANGLAPWALTVAREGLRRELGLKPWFPGFPIQIDRERGWEWEGAGMSPLEAWAELVNELEAAIKTVATQAATETVAAE
jgi:hypothetical protein